MVSTDPCCECPERQLGGVGHGGNSCQLDPEPWELWDANEVCAHVCVNSCLSVHLCVQLCAYAFALVHMCACVCICLVCTYRCKHMCLGVHVLYMQVFTPTAVCISLYLLV